MKTYNAFFLRLGEHLTKTAAILPQMLALINRMGIEQGVIAPEIAAAHGVLPENIELPPSEPEVPEASTPPTIGDLAKEEALALLRNASSAKHTAVPAMPADKTKTVQPASPAIDEH